jgi:hypothetical protein
MYIRLLDIVEHKKPRISTFLTNAHSDNGALLKQQKIYLYKIFPNIPSSEWCLAWTVPNLKVKFCCWKRKLSTNIVLVVEQPWLLTKYLSTLQSTVEKCWKKLQNRGETKTQKPYLTKFLYIFF